jgi:putative two-component system response regulator
VIRYHHERWNGKGYPYGLEGDAIPLSARIFAVADVFDALTSLRPYRERIYTLEEAVEMIRGERGEHFDPEVVDVFCDVVLRLEGRVES